MMSSDVVPESSSSGLLPAAVDEMVPLARTRATTSPFVFARALSAA